MNPTPRRPRQPDAIQHHPAAARPILRSTLRSALLSAGLVAGAAATARAAAPDPTYDQCQQAAHGTTAALMDCDRAEDQRLDAGLNNTYKTLMAALPEARKTLLRQAQRDWLAFRRDECAFRSSAEAGGSDAPLMADSCALDLTRTRIDTLKQSLGDAAP